ALQRGRISEHKGDAGEEAIEDEELPLARELGARLGGRAQALLERLLEGLGRGVGARGHSARPPNGSRAVSTSASSPRVTSPRRSACACGAGGWSSPPRRPVAS